MPKKSNRPSSLTDIVIKQFHKHQQGHKMILPGRGGAAGSGVFGSPVAVQARVAQLREELSKAVLEQTLSDMSLTDKTTSRDEEARDEVVSAVLQCINASVVAGAEAASTEMQESIHCIFEITACLACDSGDGTMAQAIVNRAIDFCAASLERVRSQGCKLLGLWVQYLVLAEDDSIQKSTSHPSFLSNNQDDSWRQECIDAAEKALVPRLADKSQAVRQAAIESCVYFGGRSNPVTDVLLWNMAHDPSVANRVAALGSVCISQHTVDQVIDRVRDVKVKVRVQALEVLAAKANIKDMTQEQCAELVRSGLTDRCDATFEASSKLICSYWMKSLKFDPVALIEFVGPTIHETECEKIARVIVDVASEGGSKSIFSELSDPEIRAFHGGVDHTGSFSISRTDTDRSEVVLSAGQLLFARVRVTQAEGLSTAKKAEIVGKVVPDIPALCEVLNKHLTMLVESIKNTDENVEEAEAMQDELCFICTQLLQLAKLSDDLKEEGSRRHFINTMKDLLLSIDTPEDLIEGAIHALAGAMESEAHLLRTVSEILSELSESEETPSDDTSVSRDLRIVSILAVVLESTSPKMASNPLLSNFSGYILPAITSADPMVREGGVSCIGQYGLLSSEETVKSEIKPLLLKVAANQDEKIEIRGQATLAICDLSLLFSDMLEASDVDGSDSISFTGVVTDMLRHDKPAVVAVAAEVAAKLHFAGKLHDPSLVSRLLTIFFHTDFSNLGAIYEEEMDTVKEVGSLVRLQQVLTLFFPAYSMKSRKGRETLAESVGPLLVIVNENQSRKIKGVKTPTWPIDKMIEYVCSTVEMGRQQNQSEERSVDESDPVDKKDPHSYKDSRIAKKFKGTVYFGTVTEYEIVDEVGLWHIKYDDGDEEHFNKKDLAKATKLYKEQKQNGQEGGARDSIGSSGNATDHVDNVSDNDVDEPDVKTPEVEPSYVLLVLVTVSKYLAEEGCNVSMTYLRAICKVLGSIPFSVESNDPSVLAVLKRNIGEARMLITDTTSLRAIKKLGEALEEVQSEDEEDVSGDEEDSLVEALDAVALSEERESGFEDKENENVKSPLPEKESSHFVSSGERSHLASVDN